MARLAAAQDAPLRYFVWLAGSAHSHLVGSVLDPLSLLLLPMPNMHL